MTMPANLNKIRSLYIIGNGFDLHHGLKTSYSAFRDFLKTNNREAFDACEKFLGCPAGADSIWGNFEEALGNFSPEEMIEALTNYFNDDDPSEYAAASFEVNKYLSRISETVLDGLQSFINSIQYPAALDGVKLPLSKEAWYLNFNYTRSLQAFYQLDEDLILHIHGRASFPQMGHGVHPSDAESSNPTPVKPTNMTPEQEGAWEEKMNESYSVSYEQACNEIDGYWRSLFKDVHSNIEENKGFFDQCNGITSITIMGHSLSGIDLPYFVEIKRRASTEAIWNVSYYSDEEKDRHISTLIFLGVPKEKIISFKLSDRVVTP